MGTCVQKMTSLNKLVGGKVQRESRPVYCLVHWTKDHKEDVFWLASNQASFYIPLPLLLLEWFWGEGQRNYHPQLDKVVTSTGVNLSLSNKLSLMHLNRQVWLWTTAQQIPNLMDGWGSEWSFKTPCSLLQFFPPFDLSNGFNYFLTVAKINTDTN